MKCILIMATLVLSSLLSSTKSAGCFKPKSYLAKPKKAQMSNTQKRKAVRNFAFGAVLVAHLAIFGCTGVDISTPASVPRLESEQNPEIDAPEIDRDETAAHPTPSPVPKIVVARTTIAASSSIVPPKVASDPPPPDSGNPPPTAAAPVASETDIRIPIPTEITQPEEGAVSSDDQGSEPAATPTATQAPQPTATQTPQPTVTQTPQSIATQTPQPTVTQTPQSIATQTPQPTATQTPQSIATQTPQPTATQTPQSIATQTPQPTATQTPQSIATQTPQPTATQTPQSTATWTPQPIETAAPVNLPEPTPPSAPAAVHEPVYLERVIPPCGLTTVPEVDPCEFDPHPFPDKIVSEGTGIPSFARGVRLRRTDAFGQGGGRSFYIVLPVHVALRGTWLPGTSRCKQAAAVAHGHFESNRTLDSSRPIEKPTMPGRGAISCFMDVVVQEYIVGDGPPRLTLESYFRSAVVGAHTTYQEHENHVLPEFETKLAGREMVLYIRPPWSLSTEVFALEGAWDVQRNEDGYYADFTSTWTEARQQLYQQFLDRLVCEEELCVVGRYPFFEVMGLSAFEQSTKDAHRQMLENHQGRIYPGEQYARIVQDVHKLTEFFEEVGAYNVEGFTPAPPPPISGE